MITVLIPAFNEEKIIEQTVTETFDVLRAAKFVDFEIIVVNDGSTDRTEELASKAGAVVINHPTNGGYGRALKSGILAASNDTIVISDADGTYPIEEIPRLHEEYEKGYDLVVAQRTGEHYRESLLKQPMRLILKFLVDFTSGKEISDVNSGLRIFDRNTIRHYFRHLSNSFSFTTSMTLAYVMTGQFVCYIPVAYHKRVGESKIRLFRDSLRTLQFIVQASVYYNPLKMFILLSGVSFVGGLVLLIIGAFSQYVTAFQLAVGSMLLSVLFFCMGLMAVLLKQIMDGSVPSLEEFPSASTVAPSRKTAKNDD